MSTGEKLPKVYGWIPPRFTPPAPRATYKNCFGLAVRRGLRLRVQPGRPGLWRLQDKATGEFKITCATLAQLRRVLAKVKTLNHKARERKHRRPLAPHPWCATR